MVPLPQNLRKAGEPLKALHNTGVANGGKSIEDAPGWREGASGKFYNAYLSDGRSERPHLSISLSAARHVRSCSNKRRQSTTSFKPWLNAALFRSFNEKLGSKPTGIADCSARAVSDHSTVAPPINVMKSRCLILPIVAGRPASRERTSPGEIDKRSH